MEEIGYQNIESLPLNIAGENQGSNNSSIHGINTPSIDASLGVYNIPEQITTPDLVGWNTSIVWSASDYKTVAWAAGDIKLANGTTYSIDAGNTGALSAVTYIYYNGTSTLQKTTTPQDAVGSNKLLLCVAKNETSPKKATFQAFGTLGLGVLITADNIAANTITANEIAANTITTSQLSATAINGMTITGATIQTAYSTDGVNRITLDSSMLRTRDSSNNLCGTIYGSTQNYAGLGSRQTLIMGVTDVIYMQSDAWCIIDSPYLYTGKMMPYPGFSNVNIGDTESEYQYLHLLTGGRVYFGDSYLYRTNSCPRRYNGSSSYYIPILTGASTNKTTNASIKMNFGGTEYYINVLAV